VGMVGEDVEDDRRAVDDRHANGLLEVALLAGQELVVHGHQVGVALGHGPLELGQLALAEVAVGIGLGAALGELPAHRHPGGAQQLLELPEVRLDRPGAYHQGTLARPGVVDPLAVEGLRVTSVSSFVHYLKDRPLTTVRRVPLRLAAIAFGVGTGLGVIGRLSDYLDPELVLLFALAAPWVVAGFVTGMAASRPLEGAVAGAAALGLSVAVYYALMPFVERRAGPHHAFAMTVLWGTGAVACGAAFGALGATVRRYRPAAALLGGALAGEAILFLLLHGDAGPRAVVLGVELVAGVAVVLAAARGRPLTALPLAGAMAACFAVADGAARVFMRTKGWGG
jgi:hypothetical protein